MERAIWNAKQAVVLPGSTIQSCPVPFGLVARIPAVASQAVELPSVHRALLFPPLTGLTPAAPAAYHTNLLVVFLFVCFTMTC